MNLSLYFRLDFYTVQHIIPYQLIEQVAWKFFVRWELFKGNGHSSKKIFHFQKNIKQAKNKLKMLSVKSKTFWFFSGFGSLLLFLCKLVSGWAVCMGSTVKYHRLLHLLNTLVVVVTSLWTGVPEDLSLGLSFRFSSKSDKKSSQYLLYVFWGIFWFVVLLGQMMMVMQYASISYLNIPYPISLGSFAF